jgi:quinohemoprotein ethanol dehydrogenase
MARLARALRGGAALAIVAAAALAGCSDPRPAQPEDGVGAEADWLAPHGSADESSYSRLDEINMGNVERLGLAWSLDLPDEVTLESTPLAVGGTLWFAGGYGEVYCVDGATGKLRWKYDPETWKRRTDRFNFGGNRGVAYEDGRVFTAGMDGRLDALDAATGKVLWTAESIPEGMLNNSSGAPRTMNGKVIIGNAGADFGARGFVTAFDAKSGKLLWRFFTAPGSPDQNAGDPVMEMAARTWRGQWWKVGTGGTVWNGITFDPELDRVYLGTGNAGPYDPELRSPGGGDNLFVASIVALDARTGKYLWHYQQNPRESWDYKSTPNMIAATLDLEGKRRSVLLHAPTNGFFYVIDRETGKLVNAPGKTTLITWAKGVDVATGRPIENPGIRYEKAAIEIWPGASGGHNWQAMSYSPRTGLAYIPVQQMGTRISRDVSEQSDTAFNVMGLVIQPVARHPGDGKGSLVAWDPVRQKQAWKVQHDHLWNGGTLATAGDLVFQGTADGTFNAYRATDGEPLWKFDAGLGIIAAPMSYSAGGRQYVAVLVGWGGTVAALSSVMDVGWKYGAQPRRLLVFALDEKGKLPPSPPRDMTVRALDDPALALNEADVAAGRSLHIVCASCHGAGFHSAGAPGPDLRESEIALREDTFAQYVHAGRPDRGMPPFDWLSEDQIRHLHAYLRARAREALGKREPYRPGGPRAGNGP